MKPPFEPMHDLPLEFWTHHMNREDTGIRGYFKGSSYWSQDGADAYGPGEVQWWSYTNGVLEGGHQVFQRETPMDGREPG